jgi:MFS family permease
MMSAIHGRLPCDAACRGERHVHHSQTLPCRTGRRRLHGVRNAGECRGAALMQPPAHPPAQSVPAPQRRRALAFVLTIGVLSLFADCTYEGSRSILGPYLGVLGASALAISSVTGFGELAGYALRLLSGRAADQTRAFWPIILTGYTVQMLSVPALALVHTWPQAAALLILERIGKGLRNPPRDALLSHAGRSLGGYGWAFGLHEALDQTGAVLGPLLVATVLSWRHDFRLAYAWLAVPALINLALVLRARRVYPRPQELEQAPPQATPPQRGYGHAFWLYLSAACLVAAGYADYPLIAFHLHAQDAVSGTWIAQAYALAMAVAGGGSLLFGRWFDRSGTRVLLPLTVAGALFAPLVFLGHAHWAAWLGVALWGLGMGVHESIIPAALAPRVDPARRASAYGLFTAAYGVAWFGGSVAIGALYQLSAGWLVAFCLLTQALALPLFARVARSAAPQGRAA